MSKSETIPETGQQTEIARLHPIDWTGTIEFLIELKQTLAMRALIINDNYSIADNILVHAAIQFIRNYMLIAHFPHYQRMGVNMGNWTPAKGRVFYNAEIPEVIVNIARHLARPRILIDGSVSLPIPALPANPGYNAINDGDIIRNNIRAGPPLPALSACQVMGSRVIYRHRVYEALRRNFAGLKTICLIKREGLAPARLMYWRDGLDRFVHLLDLTDQFEDCIHSIDGILAPIVFPDFGDLVDLPDAKDDGDDWKAYYDSMVPPAIQWLAHDALQGNQNTLTRDVFLEREASSFISHPNYDRGFNRVKALSELGEDISNWEFPALGIVGPIDEIRVLVNDLGNGTPTGNRRNTRRAKQATEHKNARQLKGAKASVSKATRTHDDPAAVDESKDSAVDDSDRDALGDKKIKGRNQRRRKKK